MKSGMGTILIKAANAEERKLNEDFLKKTN